jgi:hypothetical protein
MNKLFGEQLHVSLSILHDVILKNILLVFICKFNTGNFVTGGGTDDYVCKEGDREES